MKKSKPNYIYFLPPGQGSRHLRNRKEAPRTSPLEKYPLENPEPVSKHQFHAWQDRLPPDSEFQPFVMEDSPLLQELAELREALEEEESE